MHLNLPRVRNLYQSEQNYQPNERALFSRSLEGVLSMLLAAKRRPSVRYSRSSDVRHQRTLSLFDAQTQPLTLALPAPSQLARGLAFATVQRMKEQAELFFFQQERVSPLLLVLDRREDPVTPLLMQWTYQAMVHELIGIQNNRVDLRDVPGVPKDMHEVVLSAATDKFFRQTMYLNYGDLGASVRQLVEEYQRKVKNNQKLATIEGASRTARCPRPTLPRSRAARVSQT
jgi:vacuolar protein sorting-associated protein 45